MTSMTTYSRRDVLRLAAAGFAGVSASGWLPALAAETANNPQRRRACILLWMTGGPSQTDTFDMKPDHANGGEFKPIDTSVPGIQISEHLPQLATHMQHAAIVRSMKTKEGDHARATYHLRTGYRPTGPIHYPTLGAVLSKELGDSDAELPNFVSVSPQPGISPAAFGPGFLGPQFSPLVVGRNLTYTNVEGQPMPSLNVKNLNLPSGVSTRQADARLQLLDGFEQDFLHSRGGVSAESHQTAYRKAVRMMRSEAAKAFDLEEEAAELRERYGRNQFGQGCLLARRLVERGVPFVEVTLSQAAGSQTFGWDTHVQNFTALKALCAVLDPAWATLLSDLEDRGLLDSTLVVWMGEFGRTPKINNNAGRDHFPNAWSTVLCGGGIQGGQVVGKTDAGGTDVVDRPVAVEDLIATVCKAVGVNPLNQNMSNVGRPIRLADPEAKPIAEILSET